MERLKRVQMRIDRERVFVCVIETEKTRERMRKRDREKK